MSKGVFAGLTILIGAAFAVAFATIVLPPLFASGDVPGAFAAGFVNPYASGYSLDTICCGLLLIVWMFYERRRYGIRHGWVVIPLSAIPGVAVAFAVYLILRMKQMPETA